MKRLGMKFVLGLYLLVAQALVCVRAEVAPTPVTGDSRLVEFEYDPDQVYLVLTRPKRSTFVEFAKGERLVWVSGGDTRTFQVFPSKGGEFLEIKPTFDGAESNLNVVTNQRRYHLILRSTFEGGKWYARVSWLHPQAVLMDMTQQDGQPTADRVEGRADSTVSRRAPASSDRPGDAAVESPLDGLNFEYVVTGSAPFAPVRVFDNGVFTWVTMPERLQELPALFQLEDDDGKISLVNYEVKGATLEVQRVMPRFVLKLGKEEVRVEAKRRSLRGLFGRK